MGIFRSKARRLILESYAIEFFRAGVIGDNTWLEATAWALQTLCHRVKNSAGPVALILPPHLALTKLIKTPRIEPSKREKIIRFEAEQNIPYALSDVVWASVVVGERAIDLDVLIAAAKLDALEPLCAAAQAAGFQPRMVLPAPLATLAGFRLAQPNYAQPALVLNLGARSTTLVMAEPERFVVRSLAIGGSSITQQLAQNQDCEADEAETIKLSERSAHLTADAMETLATRLAQEITRSVLHFKRQSDMGDPSRVFLTGGAARLAGLDTTLAAKLKVPVERLDTLSAVEIERAAANNDVADHALTLTDLVGAAATQLRPGASTLNLLPPKLLSHESRRQRQPWLVAAAGLAVVALLAPVWHVRNLAAEAKAKSAAIENEIVPLRLRDARNRANLQQLEALKVEAAQLQGVYELRASWLNLFADLQARLVAVEDVWLEKLQVTPPADAGAPVKLVISGRMLDKTNPLSKVSPETQIRVKALLSSFEKSDFVAKIESERFDNNQPGILKFDFVLVADPARPL